MIVISGHAARQGIVNVGRAFLGAGNCQAQAGQLPGLGDPYDASQKVGVPTNSVVR